MIKIIRTIFAAKQDVFPSSVLKSLLFLVLIASGVFAGPMEAKAVTFNFGFYNEFVTTVNVNKSTYAPGEAIDVTGSMYIDYNRCLAGGVSDCWPVGGVTRALIFGKVISYGDTSTLIDGRIDRSVT